MIPVGSGLTLKAGKFVTLLGYEVIEAPSNPEFLALLSVHVRHSVHPRGRPGVVQHPPTG